MSKNIIKSAEAKLNSMSHFSTETTSVMCAEHGMPGPGKLIVNTWAQHCCKFYYRYREAGRGGGATKKNPKTLPSSHKKQFKRMMTARYPSSGILSDGCESPVASKSFLEVIENVLVIWGWVFGFQLLSSIKIE